MKECKMKLQIDASGAVKEINGTIDTVSGFEKQLQSLQDKLNNTKIGTDEYKKLQKEIDRTEKGLENVKNANKSWLQVMSESGGVFGAVGQSIQGVGKMFGNLNMAFKTSVIGLLATIVAKLIQKFSEMEGVMDPLTRIFDIFNGTVGRLAGMLVDKLAGAIEVVANGLEKLVNFFSNDDIGTALSDISKATDQLNDSQAEFELQQQRSNRQLQEAREIAADGTKTIQERKQALIDAGELEKQLAQQERERQLARARLQAQQIAVELGFNQERINALAKYDAAALASFQKEVDGFKGLNRAKSDELLKLLGTIEQSAADEAKINKKTQGSIQSLNTEAANQAKEAERQRTDAKKNELNAQIELEKNKAKTDEDTLRKLLEKKDELENKGTKKSKAELELQKQNREAAIKAAVKADKDAAQAEVDTEKKKQDDKLKVINDANNRDIKLKEANLNLLKTLYGEDSEAYKKAQIEINKARQKAIQDEINFIKAKGTLTDEDKARLEDLKVASINLFNTVMEQNQKEIQDGVKKNQDKLEKQKELDKAEFDYKLQKAEGDFELQREIIGKQETALDEQYNKDIAAAGNNAEKKREIELNYNKNKDELAKARETINQKEYEQQIAIAQGVANALGALSELVGKDTLAGKALGISQALINTYVGASEVLKAKAVLPEPANTIIKIVNVATTIATGLKTVREITSVKVPTEDVPEVRIRKSRGGLLKGPLHQQGGILTPFGELEGGEFVVNRASTMAFRPQLERINALGGGETELTQSVLNGTINQSSQPPIIKTYVVASEMSSQQELDRVIRDRSKI